MQTARRQNSFYGVKLDPQVPTVADVQAVMLHELAMFTPVPPPLPVA